MCKFYWPSEFEWKQSSVIRQDTCSNLQKVDEGLSLAWEAVDYVLFVVGDRSFKEERQVGKDRSHLFTINLHSWEKLGENDHIVHKRNCEEGVFTDVVGWDRVSATHKDLGRVFVKGTLWVTNEGDVLDHNLVVNLIFTWGVKSFICSDSVVENTSFGNLFWSKSLVFR